MAGPAGGTAVITDDASGRPLVPPTTRAIEASSSSSTTRKGGATVDGLSADERALYDRQIRLWGAQAQERIRNAHILLVSLRALGTEIAKNLTLAGISSLTIVDSEVVTEEDLGAQFFLREHDLGKPVCIIERQRVVLLLLDPT